jgi:biopolymer transport protein ExbD
MAGVDVGGGGGRRKATNADVNMIPFIDLLFVTVAFLLITAVWTTNARVSADAEVPGPPGCQGDCGTNEAPALHVTVNENDFSLVWKQGKTVVSETHVPRQEVQLGGGAMRYDHLAEAIAREWTEHRSHADPLDRKSDLAVLHSDDRTSFRDLVGVLDAIHGTQRDMRLADGKIHKVAAFATTFAVR